MLLDWQVLFQEFLGQMLKYVEQELAKKRGKSIDATDHIENDLQSAEDELYIIPKHLKVQNHKRWKLTGAKSQNSCFCLAHADYSDRLDFGTCMPCRKL
ncbi:uncharacterized protein LOC131251098 isoform X2 [Magnolia sinica]|uniref:uncharacterized protein LOC131251098 isoform X2 n=1 Tax=Magnolia sinica TaxID=86752 RepID=UPI00265A68A7|nr:uncharacterized protein LOC131251098 isoform X2 [Magnolia sinica]